MAARWSFRTPVAPELSERASGQSQDLVRHDARKLAEGLLDVAGSGSRDPLCSGTAAAPLPGFHPGVVVGA